MLVQLSVGTVNTPMLATIDATVSLLPSVYYIAFIVCIVLFYSNAIVGIVIDAYQSMREAFSGEDVHVRLPAACQAAFPAHALTPSTTAGRVRGPRQVPGGQAGFEGSHGVGVATAVRIQLYFTLCG